MLKRMTFLVSALLLLILANALMMTYASPVLTGSAEGFVSYMAQPAGAKDKYEAIGPFDGVRLTAEGGGWRYTAPNEPLKGNFPKFAPGPDNLFMFKDNQCKPECCGASFSCDSGGCVCTTPEQRRYINERGGNRTSPESGV